MQSFRHLTPSLRLFQGNSSLEQLGRELDRLNSRRAVIFCGATLGREGSPLELVRAAMGDRCAGIYSGVQANSPVPAVEDAAIALKRLGADAVVAVGGGSPIVTARAASILLAEKANVRDLCTRPDPAGGLISPKLLAPKIAQLVVPTTPTTAIVKAGSAVLDPATGARIALFDPKTRALAVFIHPELIATAPRALFTNAAVNTLTLAIEGLLSRAGDSISDALLMHAVRMLHNRLPESSGSDNLSMRADLIMASMLCGQGSDHTGAGVAITLGHAIGAKFNIDMGVADAIILPHVLRFNAAAAASGMDKLAAALGLPAYEGAKLVGDVVECVEQIFMRLGLPKRLRDINVQPDSFPEVAAVTMDDWYLQNNPRPIRAASEVESLLKEAW